MFAEYVLWVKPQSERGQLSRCTLATSLPCSVGCPIELQLATTWATVTRRNAYVSAQYGTYPRRTGFVAAAGSDVHNVSKQRVVIACVHLPNNSWCVMSGRDRAGFRPDFLCMPTWSSQFNNSKPYTSAHETTSLKCVSKTIMQHDSPRATAHPSWRKSRGWLETMTRWVHQTIG